MKTLAKDERDKLKELSIGQPVRVVIGNSGQTRTGKVTKVQRGSSRFEDKNGTTYQRPNGDFLILEEKVVEL